jgi:uncharacterized protein (TIGR03067 family)
MGWRGYLVLLAAVAIVATCQGGTPPEDAVRQEQQRFQGVWKVRSVEVGGVIRPAEEVAGWRLVVVADVMSARDGDKLLGESTYKLDVGPDPRTIDIAYIRGPEKGRLLRGIYRFDGARLTICAAGGGKERPTEFATQSGTDQVLYVLEREKK